MLCQRLAEGRKGGGFAHRLGAFAAHLHHIAVGRVQGGEGQVKLRGGVLGRFELIRSVLSSQSFDRIHVIIDACHAYFMVHARGGWKEDDAGGATRGLLQRFLKAPGNLLDGETRGLLCERDLSVSKVEAILRAASAVAVPPGRDPLDSC